MTQLQQMQQVINNYVKNFRPESYKFFITYGISPEHLNPSSCKELPEDQVKNMKKAFNSIEQQTKQNGSMFYQHKTAETNDWLYFGYAQDEHTKMKPSDLNCRIYLPIAENSSHDYFMTECLKMLINSKIKFTGKVAKTYRNDSLMFEFEEKENAKKFVELFMNHEKLKGLLGIHNPFLRDIQGLGYVNLENIDISKESYTSVVAKELEDYIFGLQEKDMKYGKDSASIDGFKKFLEQEKTDTNKNSAMIDQIIGEIEHCEILHTQSLKNTSQNTKQSSTSENVQVIQHHTNNLSQKELPDVEPKTIKETFNEMKELFETYKLVESSNGISLINRMTGEYVRKENNLQQLVEKVIFAKNWIGAAGVDLSLSRDINEYGIDSKQYEMAFNEGAMATFEALFSGLDEMGQTGQNFDLNDLQQFVQNATGYKYSNSLVRGLLANPQGNEIFLPQNDGVPAKTKWEFNTIKREIDKITLANQKAKTNTTEINNKASEISQDYTNISEYVKNIYNFQLIDEILKQQNIDIIDPKYIPKYDELKKLSKKELFKLLGKEECVVEVERQEWRKRIINDILEKEEFSYQDNSTILENKTDEELTNYLHNLDEQLARKQQEKEEREAYWERQKNKPSNDERSRIYNLGLKVSLLQKRMNELNEKGLLQQIPESYIQSINNTIQNLLQVSDKTITGDSGQAKSITEVIGKLWDMRSEDAIACVESELTSGKIEDAEIVNILKDFEVAKKLIPISYESTDYTCMPQSGDYNILYNEWRTNFVKNTEYCYTIEDVYKKLQFESNGEADYFFKKKKEEHTLYPKEFVSDEDLAKEFLDRMKEGVKQLEMTDNMTM